MLVIPFFILIAGSKVEGLLIIEFTHYKFGNRKWRGGVRCILMVG